MDAIKRHWEHLDWEGCPFCCCEEFLEGPHGAGSINFKCNMCGATFNDMGPFGVELVGWPEKEPLKLNSLLKEVAA